MKNIKLKLSKISKICITIQIFLIIITLGCMVYANINNINDGFIANIGDYTLWIVIALMWIPILSNNK